tara:strand:+ start:37 stop:645 length:609 start_codon:yes stop_codon:yes gene_type:complete
MDDLDLDLKRQLYNEYFIELEELLEDYHNEKTKITVGNRLNLSADGSRLKSLCLGVRGPFFLAIRKDKTLNPHLTKHTQTPKGAEIYKLLYTIIGMIFPDFQFNSIIVNFNSNFIIHKDERNVNPDSVIFTVGDHKNGGLDIYDDNKEWVETKYIKKYPIRFAGKTTYHSTEPFTGTRYCIVAYQTAPKFHYDPFEREIYTL